MNESDENKDPLVDELQRHRLAAPGLGLESRVLRAARAEWESDDVPWMFPVLRFAAILFMSAVVISYANEASSDSPLAATAPKYEMPAVPGLNGLRADPMPWVRRLDPDAARRVLVQRRQLLEELGVVKKEKREG